jgi:iron-sulfur cluster repair protein YtfE (RIC family)
LLHLGRIKEIVNKISNRTKFAAAAGNFTEQLQIANTAEYLLEAFHCRWLEEVATLVTLAARIR